MDKCKTHFPEDLFSWNKEEGKKYEYDPNSNYIKQGVSVYQDDIYLKNIPSENMKKSKACKKIKST